MKRDPATGQFVTNRPWLLIHDATNEVIGEFEKYGQAVRAMLASPLYQSVLAQAKADGLCIADAEDRAVWAFTIGRENT